MHNATVLNEAFYKFINDRAARILWSGNTNPFLKYMANSMEIEGCLVHYRSSIIKFISHQVVI